MSPVPRRRLGLRPARTSRWPSAARRRARALGEAACKKGKRPLEPVVITRPQAESPRRSGGKAWCDNLERYSDFANRLPRGRSYVRNGSVVDLQIGRRRGARPRGRQRALPGDDQHRPRWRRRAGGASSAALRRPDRLAGRAAARRAVRRRDRRAHRRRARACSPSPRDQRSTAPAPTRAECASTSRRSSTASAPASTRARSCSSAAQVDQAELLSSAAAGAVSRAAAGGAQAHRRCGWRRCSGSSPEDVPPAGAGRP